MEYVTVNREGISIISLSSKFSKRPINRNDSEDYMSHSLESINYLKYHPKNMVEFSFVNKNEHQIILYNQYTKFNARSGKMDTRFELLNRIKIDLPNLRELLLICSLYLC